MGSVRFGDYPEAIPGVGFVAAEEPKTFFQAELVFLAIFLAKLSPIARDVAREEIHRTLSTFFQERLTLPWGVTQLSRSNSGFSFDLLHSESPAVGFGFASEAPQSGAQETGIPSWREKATVRLRRQVRRGMAFIGAELETLDGRSGRIGRKHLARRNGDLSGHANW